MVTMRKLSAREVADTPGLTGHAGDPSPPNYSERIIPADYVVDPGAVLRLPIDLIDSSTLNPRKTFEPEALARLGDSLRADGLVQPIVVKPNPDGERWTIVAGERRWRAAKLIGWTSITAMIRVDVDDAAHVRLALLENLARTDLDPLEEADGYRQLQNLGMTQSAIADAVHRSQSAIAKSLQLLEAPVEVRDQLASGAISPSHVLALRRFEGQPKVMVRLAQFAAEQRTPAKDLEKKELDFGFTNALTADKLARDLSRAEFDRSICDACPFGAKYAGRYSGLCLKPEHFDELQKAARATRKAELKHVMDAAAVDGKPALRLNQLKHGQYERLDWGGGAPAGCTKKCECRTTALDGSRPVQICTRPQQLRDLREADRRRRAQERTLRAAAARKQITEAVDQVVDVHVRALALLVYAAAEQCDGDVLTTAFRHAPGFLAKLGRSKLNPDQLATLDVIPLLRIGLEVLLGEEIAALDRYDHEPTLTNWYLRPEPTHQPAATIP